MLGCGVKNSTSNLLIANCDEFIYYDDLVRAASAPRKKKAARKQKSEDSGSRDEAADENGGKREEGIEQLMDTVRSLALDYDPLWGSMVKQTIRRVNPGFNESYYGFQSFVELLKEAEKQGYVGLEYDANRGNYKVRLSDE